MAHTHTLPASAVEATGAQANCTAPGCLMPLIFTGKRWEWVYALDLAKRRKLITTFQIDKITGAHD